MSGGAHAPGTAHGTAHGGEYAIGPLDQIPPGEGRNFAVAGRVVAVFRTRADEVFASQPDCPHARGPLADGMLAAPMTADGPPPGGPTPGDAVIVCPLHERAYDLRTGAAIAGECGLAVYPIRRTEDGQLLLTLP
jgi:nitrite reductase (NADH) small subunit